MPTIVTRGAASLKALGFAGAGKPLAPTIGTLTRTSSSISVPFTDGYNGGSPITGYTVTSTPGNYIFTGSSSPIAATGMTLGTNYTFTVRATNVYGDSPESASSDSIKYASTPLTPTIGTATIISPTSVTVSFTAPSSNGGEPITSYTAISTPGSITGTLSQAGSGTITVTGLTSGTAYTFKVYATNAIGNGPSSVASNSVTPDLPTYTISSSLAGGLGSESVNEGLTASFYIDTNETVTASTLYWSVSGTGITAGDFTGGTTGSVSVTPTVRATVTLTITADSTTEGTETFTLNLYTNSGRTTLLSNASISGYVIGNGRAVSINDTSTTSYSVTPGVSSVNEGGSVTFTATRSDSASSTAYWSIQGMSGTVNSSDLSTTGTVSISSGSGTFNISLTSDQVTEGTESFRILLYSDSGRSALVAISSTVTINDTSTYPAAGTFTGTSYCSGYTLYYRYHDGSGGTYDQAVQSNSPSCGYVPPTLGASVPQSVGTGSGYADFNYVIFGPNSNTKAYYFQINNQGGTGSFTQNWSVSTTAQLNGKFSSGFGSGSSGTFSGNTTNAIVGFTGPHDGGNAYITVSATGYTSYQATVLVPANPRYTPYTWYNGFAQEFRSPGPQLNLAYGIGEGIYRSNGAYTVEYNDGLGPRVRYGFFRDPDAGGVDYWTGVCINNGWNWDTPAFVSVIMQTAEISGDTRCLTQFKSYQFGTGYGDLAFDRPV